MKTRNLIFTALTALVLASLAGCSSETELPQETPDPSIPEGMTRIDFAIKGVKVGTSYATSVGLEEHERTIKDVTAYFFRMADGQSTPLATDAVTSIVSATSMTNGKGSLIMPASTKAGIYSVVFVANKACFSAALGEVEQGVTTYGELNAIETLSNPAIMQGLSADPATNKGLPMYALTKSVILPASGGKVDISADFRRPLSRFDIDNEAVHSFEVTSVALANARSASPLNAAGNEAGKNNLVAGEVVASVEYPTLVSDVNEKLAAPVNGKQTQLRPAFYAAPGLSTDGTLLKITGKLRVGLDEIDRTYTIALKNVTDGKDIVIGANKRYGVTLKMTQGGDITAEIEMRLGAWDDDLDEATPDMPQEIYFIVAPESVSPGVVYSESTHTFEVVAAADGSPKNFQFRMLSTQPGATVAYDGNVVANVLSLPNSYATDVDTEEVNYKDHLVTVVGVSGNTGYFTFTKDNKSYKFNVKLISDDSYPVPGVTEKAILVNGLYWAPVNVGALSSTVPGKIFQFGRMSEFTDAGEIKNNEVTLRILPSEANAAKYNAKYINARTPDWWAYRTAQEETVLREIFDRWKGVSQDESIHPCPVGWRLPTLTEADKLIRGGQHTAVQVTSNVWKVTVQGVTFTSKEYYSYTEGSRTGTSRYWLSGDGISFDSNIMKLMQCTRSDLDIGTNFLRATTDGCYIRCVKDVKVQP